MKYFLKQHLLKSRYVFLAFLLFFAHLPSLLAQNKDSKGKDFWLMFNGNLGTPTVTLFITSSVNTTGNVSIPGLAFSQNFNVVANTVTSVVLPNSVATHTNDVKDSKGIHVTAVEEVTVYGLNYVAFTTDAYLGLPTDALGTDYIVMAYTNGNGVQFGIVASEDATTVTIVPTINTGARLAGVPYNISLNKGEVYELRNGNSGADLTGTTISSTKPIGVFSGAQCGNVPVNQVYCDHMVEMLSPTTTWGRKFGTVPLKSRIKGDTWRFLASENNTIVKIDGVAQPAINRGKFVEKILTAQSVIESDKPILVCQYSNGSGFSGNPGDPFMMLIPPLEQFLAKYTVTTVTGYIAHYINIVAPTGIAGTLTLDGVVVPAASFTPIGTTGFSGAQIQVQPGTHNLNGTLPFGVFMYGFNNDDSYGYPGGQSFSEVAIVNNLTVAPKNGTAAIGTNTCFNATVRDQFNNAVSDIRVDFNITGPNASKSGFAITNASGVAQFCYTGTVDGTDNIAAVVGSLTDNAQFIWTNLGCNLTGTASVLQEVSNNGNDGKIQLTANGGTAPYSYTLGGNTNNTGLFENLAPGNYNYTIKDDKNCTFNGSIVLKAPIVVVVNNVKCPKDTVIMADPATCLAKLNWTVPNNPFPDTIQVPDDGFGGNKLLLKGTLNGHGYYLSTGYYKWFNADKIAWNACGHLVTITNQAESDFILDKFPSQGYGPWIGLIYANNVGFKWTTDEPFVYTNWAPTEPNNLGGWPGFINESFGHIWGYDPQNRWNDLGDAYDLPFIAEFEKPVLTYKQIKGPELGSVVKPGIYEICYEISNCSNGQKDTCCFNIEVKCKQQIVRTPCVDKDSTIVADPNTCKAVLTWEVPVNTFLPSIPVANGMNGNSTIELGGIYNGHGYYLSSDMYYWPQAKTAASGVGAHLVSITTPGESGFIYDYFRQGNVYGPWIGLSNTGTPGSFEWVTGEPFVFSNWSAGEPNNLGGNNSLVAEPYVHIMGWDPANGWNDLNEWGNLKFIAEFDSPNITYRQIEGPAYGTEVDPGTYRICYEITNTVTGVKDTCCFTLTVVCDDDDDNDRIITSAPVPVANGTELASRIQPSVNAGATAAAFKVVASPNPTVSSFRLRIESNNVNEKVSIQVVDVMGRLVEMRNNLNANTTLIIGDKYLPGIYVTKVTQGNKNVMVKLVKQ